MAAATAEQATSVTGLVQANAQMRKTAQEVKKAMAEQARAARDILKAAQNTTEQAAQVRKATAEQAKTAGEIAQAAESMRRGAATHGAGAGRAGDRRRADLRVRPTSCAQMIASVTQGDDRAGGGDERDRRGGRRACAAGRADRPGAERAGAGDAAR